MYWTTHRDLAFVETLQPREEIMAEIIFGVLFLIVMYLCVSWIAKKTKFDPFPQFEDDEPIKRGPNDTEIIPPEVLFQAQQEALAKEAEQRMHAMERSFEVWTPQPTSYTPTYYKVKRGVPLPEMPQKSRPVPAGEEDIRF